MTDNTFNKFIVGVYSWNDSEMIYEFNNDATFHVYDDGKFKINNEKGDTLIESTFIDGCAYVLSNVKTVGRTFDVEIVTSAGKFGIRFDKSSSASHNKFMDEYNKIKSKRVATTRHPSGKVKLEGFKDDEEEYTGMCVEYYDNYRNTVKYIGEFEDGDYDGSGEFFSSCGTLRLVVNNICSGVPNGVGKLFVAGKHMTNINFKTQGLESLDSKSDTYCEDVLRIVNNRDHINIIQRGRFDLMTTDEKLSYLFDEIATLKLGDRENLNKRFGIF